MSKLYRSRSDRKITGLCGGLAESMNVDATLLRLIVVVTAFFSGGVVIPLYFLAALVIPSEPWTGGPHGYGPSYSGDGCGHPGGNYPNWREWRRAEKHYRRAQRHGWAPPHEGNRYEGEYAASSNPGGTAGSDLDDMMKDIEKKAMWKEIEELRSKVAQYEKNQNQKPSKGDV
ncbi:PspC domain-containing protein [Paenibacillus ehimensis]|uniref:PspC domain-containing protein n=1 Tax=Paenibacillus ehimensis TaxID=79264 RepID=A0ABT8VJF5_9BACL|nr:PspC domain-containing protein [Paenibacillus ehimensis]MDO3681084.1 PspC domain-containing protein [Paenibacillus ehimensis]MEC0212449.1 PspC domain-containing protein [Paenibacillus ehimensis]